VRRFGRFWWDFLVGDDWRIAAGVLAAIILTALLSATEIPTWWVLPLTAAGVLWLSLWRYTRRAP
jgi:hypothetical protein